MSKNSSLELNVVESGENGEVTPDDNVDPGLCSGCACNSSSSSSAEGCCD